MEGGVARGERERIARGEREGSEGSEGGREGAMGGRTKGGGVALGVGVRGSSGRHRLESSTLSVLVRCGLY